MNLIFQIVAGLLNGIALVTGLTYNEINIIAYYLILPFIYVALFDRILKKHYLKIIYAATWAVALICIPNFRTFSDKLFDLSVDFLLSFKAVGLDYVEASVVICVILPSLVLVALVWFAFPRPRERFIPTKRQMKPTRT